MSNAFELVQALDAAFAAYQRHFGRERALAKLADMIARGREAQRVLDEANGRIGGEVPRAAE